MPQYSAKLLLQYRRRIGRRTMKRVLCEERILTFRASSPEAALRKAKQLGSESEHDYEAADGGHIFFEFVGIMELQDVSISYGDGEVWFEFRERYGPRTRLRKLIPKEADLSVFADARPTRVRLA